MKKKKIILSLIIMILMISNNSYAKNAYMPNINAQSGILIEKNSGTILYSKNINKKLPMASTTKIMTALIAIENGNLDENVIIKSNCVGIEGSSIYLQNQEKISLRDLLYGLMLRSGNDAAAAIACHIGGSVENFVSMMNTRAKRMGLHDTHFSNPSGLPDKNHYTTAYDLSVITRIALKNKEFKKVVSTKNWVSNREYNKYFYNKNKTLWQYDGGDGVKIGYTKNAGRCLVASATRNGMQLIAVVLNDGNWFNDCYKLFDYGFQKYKPIIVFDKNQYVKSIDINNGKKDKIDIVTNKELMLPLRNEDIKDIKILIELPNNIDAPVKINNKLGAIKVFIKGNLIANVDLVSIEDVEEKSRLDKLIDFGKKLTFIK